MKRNEEAGEEFAAETPIMVLDSKGVLLHVLKPEPVIYSHRLPPSQSQEVIMSGSAAALLLSPQMPPAIRREAERMMLATMGLVEVQGQRLEDWRFTVSAVDVTMKRLALELENVYFKSIKGWYQAYFIALVILVFLLVYRLA